MGNNNGDKTFWEEIHTLMEVVWASENWQPAIICPNIRREINCK